jgi:ADP-ribose pyrophosphatase YjhB (NUDIX family)
VAVALDADRVLLHRVEGQSFWSPPGGRVELGEPAAEALRREMREELGTGLTVQSLLWLIENFYRDDGTNFHELALYFRVAFPAGSGLYGRPDRFHGDEEGMRLIFRWFPVDGLEEVTLYPTFLRTALRSPPEHTEHVVHVDPSGGEA